MLQSIKSLMQMSGVLCSAADTGEGGGPAAAWWEEWDTLQPSDRKRKFPTSRPSAEDEREDQALDDMNVTVNTDSLLHCNPNQNS